MHKRLRTKVGEQKTEIANTKKSVSKVAETVKDDPTTSDYLTRVWDRLEELEKNYENLEKSCLAQLNKMYSNPVFLRLSQYKPLKINRRTRRGVKTGNQPQSQNQTTTTAAVQPQQSLTEIINEVNGTGISVFDFRKESIYPHSDSVFN